MLVLQGYFENNTFHPDTNVRIPDGKKAVVTVTEENALGSAENGKEHTRRLGTLAGKMSVEFADDWYMTDEELVSL